jgi:hypothetical protein
MYQTPLQMEHLRASSLGFVAQKTRKKSRSGGWHGGCTRMHAVVAESELAARNATQKTR